MTAKPDKPRGFPVALTIATAIALAILCSLGFWQVQRLHWKEGLLARIDARGKAAPVGINQAFSDPDPEFMRVEVACTGLGAAPFVELYAIRDGQAGTRIVSACRPAGTDRTVLIDRGFVADTVSARPPVAPSAEVVRMVGVVRKSEKAGAFTPVPQNGRFYVRDVLALTKALKVTGDSWGDMLVAETSSNPEWKALIPAPLPGEISNRHFDYILTWFGLAGALLAVYVAMLWRRLRSR